MPPFMDSLSFTEGLLCSGNCAECWGWKKNKHSSACQELMLSSGKETQK